MSIEQRVSIDQQLVEKGIHPDLNEKLNEIAPLLKQILAGSQGKNVFFGPTYTGTTSRGEDVSILTICSDSIIPDFQSLGREAVFPRRKVIMLARSSSGFPIGFQELNMSYPHIGHAGIIMAEDTIITGLRDQGITRVLENAAQDWYEREATNGNDIMRKIKNSNPRFIRQRNDAARREIERREENPGYNPTDEYYYDSSDVSKAWLTKAPLFLRRERITPYPDITTLEDDPEERNRYLSIFGPLGSLSHDERYHDAGTISPEAPLHAYMMFGGNKGFELFHNATISLDDNIMINLAPEFYESDTRQKLLQFCMNWADVGGVLKSDKSGMLYEIR